MCQPRTAETHPACDAWAAIDFALDILEPWEVAMFLLDFRRGELSPWSEFSDYRATRASKGPNDQPPKVQAT